MVISSAAIWRVPEPLDKPFPNAASPRVDSALRAERVRLIVAPLNSSSILRALLLLCVFIGHAAAADAKKPNILVIVADDLG